MDNCRFELNEGTLCGLPLSHSGSRYCRFHHKGTSGEIVDANDIRTYTFAFQAAHKLPLDLSGVSFKEIQFDISLLKPDSMVVFARSKFTNCAFWACKLTDSDFSQCEFKTTTFHSNTFSGRLGEFHTTEFNDCWIFDNEFGNANFAGAIIKNSPFLSCQFKGSKCKFPTAQISGNSVLFQRCDFGLGEGTDQQVIVDFSHSILKSDTLIFNGCSMKAKLVKFDLATIRAQRFVIAIFALDSYGPVSFTPLFLALLNVEILSLGSISVSGSFLLTQRSEDREFATRLALVGNDFCESASIRISGVNLQRATLRGSLLERIRFSDVTWPCRGGYAILNDQLIWESTPSHMSIAALRQLYVQLKRNYEENRDFQSASHWHIREMETRRLELEAGGVRRLRSNWWKLLMLRSYGFASDYGENYLKPAWLLVLLLVICVPFYVLSGFQFAGKEVCYSFSLLELPSFEVILDICRAFLFSLSAMALQVGRSMQPTGLVSHFVWLVQVILTISLVSLLLLALKRSFKR